MNSIIHQEFLEHINTSQKAMESIATTQRRNGNAAKEKANGGLSTR